MTHENITTHIKHSAVICGNPVESIGNVRGHTVYQHISNINDLDNVLYFCLDNQVCFTQKIYTGMSKGCGYVGKIELFDGFKE